jgi:IS5 family transposase
LSASIWGASRYPTRRRCAAFAICSKRTTGRRLFAAVPRHLAAKGLKVAAGTIVDATIIIINAPSSPKNAGKARDPEMHRTKKGNQRHFGTKAQLGLDRRAKLLHPVVATAAKIADGTVPSALLPGRETRIGAIRRIAGSGR